MKLQFIFPIFVLSFLCMGSANAQVVLTAEEVTLSAQDQASLDRQVRNYAVFTLDTSELLDSLQTYNYCRVQLYINEQWNWEFYLKPEPSMISPNCKEPYITDEGVWAYRPCRDGYPVFRGKTSNNETAFFTISETYFSSSIFSNKGIIGIGVTRSFTENRTDESLIAFKTSDLIIGIDDPEYEPLPVSVYPNPTSDVLTVDYNLPVPGGEYLKITIYDVQGQVVKVYEALDQKTTLNLDDLAAGIYLVQVSLSNGSEHKISRIVVRK